MHFRRKGIQIPSSKSQRQRYLEFRRAGFKTVFMILLLCTTGFSPPQEPSQEYKIKAVFLFNFVQFVEWPASAFQSPTSPIIIGILGDDPFGPYLDATVKGEVVRGHPLEVRRFASAEDAVASHILFLPPDGPNKPETALPILKGRHILTVGETTAFARRGGIIRFFTDNNKIKIRINLDVAKEEDLSISSKLLRLAEVVSSAP